MDVEIFALEHEPKNAIAQGILFNVNFIITYQLSLLLLIAVLSLRYWTHRLWRRSTIKHLALRKDNEHHESTPLLLHKRYRVQYYQLFIRRFRSIFIYHPTYDKKALGNDTTTYITLLLGLNLFFTFFNISLSRALIFIFADRVGLLFVANLPWLYLLSAKNQPFQLLTGHSYEALNIFHRALGKWLMLLALLHATGMVTVWYDFLRPRGLDIWWFLAQTVIWVGIGALSSYLLLGITSMVMFRQWWYEMFLGCHIVLQLGGLGFLFFHYRRCQVYVVIALSIFLIDRLVFRLLMKTRTVTADLKTLEDGQTIMVSASWTLQPPVWFKRYSIRQGWKSTDHVFITLPALKAKHKLQAHPFTIASAAPTACNAWLDLIIRVRDGFTRDLLQYAELHNSILLRIDGPYGNSHAVDMLEQRDVAVVIAGGSGIAVAYPIVWHLCNGRPSKVCLIWIINDARHISWIGEERLRDLEELGLKLVIPLPTLQAGRPDMAQLLVDNVAELRDSALDERVGVVVSGPDAMNRSVRNTCARMAWQGMDVEVAVEVFDW